MTVFDRPNAAMRAYERRLASQPISWPPTTHPIPTLWERARALFKATVETIGSAMRLAFKPLTRIERRDLILRLEPVEKLVRMLLLTDAITFLLMTPQGLKLRRETQPCAIPAPPGPVGKKKSLTEAERFRERADRAMQTIALLQPKPEPAPEAATPAAPADESSKLEDALANCTFRVLHWSHEDVPVEPVRKRRVWIDVLGPPRYFSEEEMHAADIRLLGLGGRKRPPPRPDPDSTTGSRALARRIAALSRILDNPASAIRRLAERIASLPRDCFEAPLPDRLRAAAWWHGRPEYYNAITLLARAHRALMRTEEKPEPG